MDAPYDVMNEIVALVDFESQWILRSVCRGWKRAVDANSIFQQRNDLYRFYSEGSYDHMAHLVTRYPTHIEFASGLFGKARHEHHEYTMIPNIVLHGSLSDAESFIFELSKVGDWDHLREAIRCGIFAWHSRREYQITMGGAASASNVPLMVRIHREFNQRKFERSDLSMCDFHCSPNCAFGSDLHWDYICRQAIKGCSVDAVSVCYRVCPRLAQWNLYIAVFLTGNVSFARSYEAIMGMKTDSFCRYVGWKSLETFGAAMKDVTNWTHSEMRRMKAMEGMIEYLWSEEKEWGGSFNDWRTFLQVEPAHNRDFMISRFNQRVEMYLKSK